MKLDKLFGSMTSDGHIPCGLVVFIIGSIIHWFHHIDVTYVSFSTTVLTFLGAHSFIQNKYPGTPDPNEVQPPQPPQ